MDTLSIAGHKSDARRRFDAKLARLAERQHLVFSLWQLQALGLTARSVQRRVETGRLHRIHQAVYALVPPSRLTVRGRYLAAVLACTGPRTRATAAGTRATAPRTRATAAGARATAALSHRSAADLHGLRTSHRRPVEVLVAGRTTHRHPGIEVHRSQHLDPVRDLTTVDGIPTTTIARTLLDLAAVVARRPLEQALDRAETLRVFDLLALTDQLERNARHPGAGRLRAALATHTAGETVTDSELEELLYALLVRCGLPHPVFRAAIDPGDGEPLIRPDFSWRAAGVALELDGRAPHLTRRAFEQDRRRDQRLTAAGWRVIRVTWRQLSEEPERIARLLADLLAD